jgi:Ankyrin repeats (many copies)
MTSKDNGQDEELLERYRRASDTETAAPSEAVRAAILAEGRRAAEARAKEMRGQPVEASRPAANDSRWKITAFGTAAAALLATFLFAPRLWESAPPPPTASSATASGTTAQPPKLELFSASPNSPQPPQEVIVTQARRENSKAAAAASAEKVHPQSVAPPPAASIALAAPSAAAPAVVPMSPSLNAARAARARSTPQPATLLSTASDARDEQGRTPLMLAVMQGRRDVVRSLLDHGADPNVADSNGRTPLQQAKQSDLREIAAMLERAGAR